MQRFRNILVGVNLCSGDRLAAEELTPTNEETVRRAIWLASRVSGRLTFFSVLEISAHTEELLHDEFDEVSATVEDAARADLDKLVARAAREHVTASSHIAFGSPWIEIVKQVLREKHDLCLVGASGSGAASRFLFGTTGSKLLRNCPCPVWVARPDTNYNNLRILVPSDFSDVSSLALELAVNTGQLTDSRVHLLHANVDTAQHHLWFSKRSAEDVAAFREKKRAEAEQALHNQLAGTDYRTLAHGAQVHVKEGAADAVILDAIDEFDIDLLVMGTLARSGIPGMIIGNTAEQLLPHVSCSILALKPENWHCPIEID